MIEKLAIAKISENDFKSDLSVKESIFGKCP